jgi:hypothetical protein
MGKQWGHPKWIYFDIPRAVGIADEVKHAAVDHVVKDLRQFFVGKGVHYEESDCHSSFSAASIENQPCDVIGGFSEY